MIQTFFAYIRILRPLNFFFVLIAVLFGAYYKMAAFPLLYPLLAGIAATLISGGGYVINDLYDYSIDMINRKERVLPSGLITTKKAKYYGICLFVLGIIISIFLHDPWIIALAVFNSALLFIYAMKSKRIHFWGNLLVAFVTASTFIFGSFITNNLRYAFFVGLCAFFYTMIRELVKDIEDKNGDSSAGAKTLPILWGDKKTLLLALLFWIGFTLTIIWGYPELYTLKFFILLLVGIVFLILVDLIILIMKPLTKTVKYSESFMKVHMLVFLIILWVAQ
ncbi:MAG: geranylgeranylglycerol-phosphate geranylgeranyltransferase [Candidatus Cloacimonetes bacterium]|nr:geranylgeranylglycerol-phosphate geranylgeranyltransferase [Candidatus Cloacimonadota bacterium]